MQLTGDDDAFPSAPEPAPWASLGLREEAAVYESASQNARVLTEGWVAASVFCPNCGAQPISRFATNRPVADFLCDACQEEYELKSQTARLGARVVDGAWATMTARLQAQNNPNLLVIRYDREGAAVSDLVVTPKPFFTPEAVERLGASAFTLDDVYAAEAHLARLYPANDNVRAKVRQQLQVLRDAGLVVFEGRGRHRLARGD